MRLHRTNHNDSKQKQKAVHTTKNIIKIYTRWLKTLKGIQKGGGGGVWCWAEGDGHQQTSNTHILSTILRRESVGNWVLQLHPSTGWSAWAGPWLFVSIKSQISQTKQTQRDERSPPSAESNLETPKPSTGLREAKRESKIREENKGKKGLGSVEARKYFLTWYKNALLFLACSFLRHDDLSWKDGRTMFRLDTWRFSIGFFT